LSNKIEYRAFDKANNINAILKSVVKEKSFGNWLPISGNYSDDGGFEIYKSFTSTYSTPYLGPFIKAHTTVVNTNWAKTTSKIIIKRINGASYYTHFFICIIIIALIFIKSLTNYINKSEFLEFEWHITPLFCGIYMLLVELWAMSSFNTISNRIIELVNTDGIEVKKL